MPFSKAFLERYNRSKLEASRRLTAEMARSVDQLYELVLSEIQSNNPDLRIEDIPMGVSRDTNSSSTLISAFLSTIDSHLLPSIVPPSSQPQSTSTATVSNSNSSPDTSPRHPTVSIKEEPSNDDQPLLGELFNMANLSPINSDTDNEVNTSAAATGEERSSLPISQKSRQDGPHGKLPEVPWSSIESDKDSLEDCNVMSTSAKRQFPGDSFLCETFKKPKTVATNSSIIQPVPESVPKTALPRECKELTIENTFNDEERELMNKLIGEKLKNIRNDGPSTTEPPELEEGELPETIDNCEVKKDAKGKGENLAIQVESQLCQPLVAIKPHVPANLDHNQGPFSTIYVNCHMATCSMTFPTVESLDEHMLTVHQLNKFCCPVPECDASFETKAQLKAHCVNHADIITWSCSTCSLTFPSHVPLLYHQFRDHEVGLFKCTKEGCTFTGEHRGKLFVHLNDLHENKLSRQGASLEKATNKVIPSGPSKLPRTTVESGNFSIIRYKTTTVKCILDSCNDFFLEKRDLNVHLWKVHLLAPILCSLSGCRASFVQMEQLEKHTKEHHSTIDRWPCRKCGKAYRNSCELHLHVYREHQEGQFGCTKCPKVAKHRGLIIQHYDKVHLH